MRHVFFLIIAMTLAMAAVARAGDSVAPRQNFKETTTYPFIFKAEGYLASRGPVPMRFAPAAPKCEERKPPAPPVIAAKPEPPLEPAGDQPKNPAEQNPPPEVVATTTDSTPKKESPDFAKVPDEVLDFFKNTEGRPVRRAYLFDPIFQPVTPDDLPKSKATAVQK